MALKEQQTIPVSVESRMLLNTISRKPTTAVCLYKYTITFTVPRDSTSPARYVANNTSVSNVHATVTVQSTKHLNFCKFTLDVQKLGCCERMVWIVTD